MHTVKFPLKTTAYDEQVIEKRFRALSHIHNVMVKHGKKLLKKLEHHAEYQSFKAEYVVLSKKGKPTTEEKMRKTQLSKCMSQIRQDMGLSEASFQSYLTVCARQFRKCLSSQQIQKEATRVWMGVEKVLFSDGKDIHFKKQERFHTIGGKSNTNGVKFNKESMSIGWNGLNIRCSFPRGDISYIIEAMDADISYCEIERKIFPNGWHYYVIVYLKGDPPRKMCIKNTNHVTGVDIGTSTIATVSDNMVTLEELAPRCASYNKRIEKLSRKMDRSKRISNPEKYNADGTVKKGDRSRWVYSNTYLKDKQKLRTLYRQKAEYIKHSHEKTVKELIQNSVLFITEEMSYRKLQRKAKKTERSYKTTEITTRDGFVKTIRKYKRKKRFGRSLNNRAPALFLAILKRKAVLYGGQVKEVDIKKFKASQYDHVADEYKKIALNERFKMVGKHLVQRDLYSAFLLKNANSDLDGADKEKCSYEFEKFVEMMNERIAEMKENNISMKQCFGF